MCCILIEQKIIHIHYNDLYGHPLTSEPQPRGHEIYNSGRPFPGHHYSILSLSDLCMGEEKMSFKEIMHFHYIYTTYMATPQPGHHEIYILVDLSLVIITIHLFSLNHAPEQRRGFLNKYISFTLFTQITISCLLTLQMLHIKFG